MSHINIDPRNQILTLTWKKYDHIAPVDCRRPRRQISVKLTLRSSSPDLSMHHHSLWHAFLCALGRSFPSCPMHIHEFLSGTKWLGMYRLAIATCSQVCTAREPATAVGSYHMCDNLGVPNIQVLISGRKITPNFSDGQAEREASSLSQQHIFSIPHTVIAQYLSALNRSS